jgi:hypothetical protein
MPGPTQPWDQSGDPRESTVDLPRLDLSGLAEYFRGASPLSEQEPAGLLEPLPEQEPAPESRSPSMPRREPRAGGLGHPYAAPDSPRLPLTQRAVQLPVRAAGQVSASSSHQGLPVPGPGAVAPNVSSDPDTPNAVPSDPVAPNPVAPNPVATDPVAPNPVAPNPVAPNSEAAQLARANPVVAPRAQPVAQPRAVPAPPSVPAPSSVPVPTADHVSASSAPERPIARTRPEDRPTGARPVSRSPAGSLADLRSRLARLPDGHPSSPYDDGGRAKPVPIRLRQLELGLPAPSREPGSSLMPDIELEDIQLEPRRKLAEPALRDPAGREPSIRDPAGPGPGLVEPDQAVPDGAEPDSAVPDTAEPARSLPVRPRGDRAPHDPAPRDPAPRDPAPRDPVRNDPARNDPAHGTAHSSRLGRRERDNPYADAGGGRAAPETPADLSLGPWHAAPPPRVSGLEGLSARGGNGHGPPNGHDNGSHQRTSRTGPDRPARGRSDGARQDTVQHPILEPRAADLRALVEGTVANARTAEGRNVFGSYGSSGLTPAIQRLSAHLPFGGLAPGSEGNSLKSPERFAAKLTRLIARNPGRTAEELAATISDVVRYAFALDAADYVEGTWLVHRRLKSHGFELEIRRNRWESPEYKGIFTQWRDPAHHLPFEVQFHTTASWAVVQRTYDAYIQITNPATPPAERARLRARQVAAAADAKPPPNWAEIGDFRLEPR